jgi:putative FmdB family regulatory protein
MPIYEFECQNCGNRFSEFFRRMSSSDEKLDVVCPRCQSRDTQRVVSSFAVRGVGESGGGAAEAEAPAPKQPAVTPKEQIDKWRTKNKCPVRSPAVRRVLA